MANISVYNNKILNLTIFTAILILAGFGFAKEVSADEIEGWFISINLLQGVSPAPTSIDSFAYYLSAKPENTEAKVQFSNDNTHWYNSSGTLGGEDILEEGNHEIDLSELNWSGASFYYKIIFISFNGIDTPVLDEITVNYTKGELDCESILPDYSEVVQDCNGGPPAWTYCKCKYEKEKSEGYRISPEFDISGEGEIVKDSRIFWQTDERFDGNINVKVNVLTGGEWKYEQEVINGGRIPGLEPGINLSGAKIQTKTSFVGGPDFYPSLENIKIFIELE